MLAKLEGWMAGAWRSGSLDAASSLRFDVAVIGGGINGACLLHRLRQRGYRVVVLERADFGAGTSQASGMMIWGGLLYLRSLDVGTVIKLCRARDEIIRRMPEYVEPRIFRYCAKKGAFAWPLMTFGGMYLYWLMGRFRRARPLMSKHFPEDGLILERGYALTYEEGSLTTSDCRFVLQWIMPHRPPEAVALNYCEVIGGVQTPTDRTWMLQVGDLFTGRQFEVHTNVVVNCAGVWTDRVNACFGIESPYKHALSKGVYICFERDSEQTAPLIFEMESHGDVITSVPWGPITMWGPTETVSHNIEEDLRVAPEDVRFLLAQQRRCLRTARSTCDIVSMRCGIRPLAVPASYASDRYPLKLSRRFRHVVNRERRWISAYGGKLTACLEVADRIVWEVRKLVEPTSSAGGSSYLPERDDPPQVAYPGLTGSVPDPRWCVDNEFCCTLEDYLRRRTNIAQWVPRGGLGWKNEHVPHLLELCRTLAPSESVAHAWLENYLERVKRDFDNVIAAV